MDVCRWYKDPDVPDGRYLVPGCMNRAVYGDHADCHCPKIPRSLPKEAKAILERLADMRLDRDQIDEAHYFMIVAAIRSPAPTTGDTHE